MERTDLDYGLNERINEAIDEHSWREKMKQLMNIHGEKNVQREKCSAPMASNRRRNLLSLKRGRYAGFFSIKFLLFFVCRKGRNKICYIRHIFSVFLKITPKLGRILLRSLDGFYSEVWTGFTPKFGRVSLRSLDGIYSEVWTEWGRSYTESAEVFSTRIARMERTVFETLMFKKCFTKCR